MRTQLRNRREAGRLLVPKLSAYASRSDVLVLGLPRGGVPAAYEIAQALKAPLDVWLVRKLGVPGNKELAMGAISLGKTLTLEENIVKSWGISQQTLARVIAQETRELERRDRTYRGHRPLSEIRDRTVLLVDDGIATGSTMLAAIASLRKYEPAAIAIVTPVIPPSARKQLLAETDVEAVIYLISPERFYFLGFWYDDFSSTSDDEVCDLLARGACVSSPS